MTSEWWYPLLGIALVAALLRSARRAAAPGARHLVSLAPIAPAGFTPQTGEVCYWAETSSSLVTLQAGSAEDTGTLYVTNKRLDFAGQKQRRSIALDDVIAVQPFEGGVRIDARDSTPVAFTARGDELAEMIERVRRDRPVTVTLISCGPNKIAVIKAVRMFTGLGLVEAKDVVERTPALLALGVPKTEGLALQAQLQSLGAGVKVE